MSEIENVIERVKHEMKAGRLTQTQVAKEVGISTTGVSQWLSGTYPGDVDKLTENMARWADSRAVRRELAETVPTPPEWVDMKTSGRIIAALRYAQMFRRIAVVYGGAGLSKSMTAAQYKATFPAVWIATMTPASSSIAACLDQIAQALHLKLGHCSPAKLEAAIVDRMRDTNGLLIVDEAQHLPIKSLEALRSIHDATGVGMAVLGNEMVYTRLTGGARASEFAQLFSRIGKRLRLARPCKEDVQALAEAWGITGDAEVKELYDIAARPGGLRVMTHVLQLAPFMAGQGNEVNLQAIRAAWKDMGGDA